jgi:hypothetical protein
MEAKLSVAQQTVWFDREATVGLYSQTIIVPGADSCNCLSCRNFAAQRVKVFPEEFVQFLGELGIDPLKEWEAFDCDFGVSPDGHLYGGWFLFIGGLVDGSRDRPESQQAPFAYWFTTSFPTGTLPIGLKFCAVEFIARVPWILSETP